MLAQTSRSAATTGSLGRVVGTVRLLQGVGFWTVCHSRAVRYGPERVGDQRHVPRRLRALDLVQLGEPQPPLDELPQLERLVAVRRVDDDRSEEALAVGEEQRRHAEPAGGDDLVVLGADVVVRRRVGDGPGDEARVEPELDEQLLGDLGPVRLAALLVQGPAGPLVPRVEQGRVLAAEQGADAHHRPAVGPLALPRVLLALDPVDLLQAEEPPAHLEPGQVAHLAHPPRRLVGPRAHHVEVEVHALDPHQTHRCPSRPGPATRGSRGVSGEAEVGDVVTGRRRADGADGVEVGEVGLDDGHGVDVVERGRRPPARPRR